MDKIILIVEDEKKNMKLLRDVLRYSGYKTLEATNGQMGIEYAKEKKPDIILMDIQLPIIDGIQATKILKEDKTTKDIPILVISAFAMIEDKKLATEAGCDGFLTKPVDIKKLVENIEEYIS